MTGPLLTYLFRNQMCVAWLQTTVWCQCLV